MLAQHQQMLASTANTRSSSAMHSPISASPVLSKLLDVDLMSTSTEDLSFRDILKLTSRKPMSSAATLLSVPYKDSSDRRAFSEEETPSKADRKKNQGQVFSRSKNVLLSPSKAKSKRTKKEWSDTGGLQVYTTESSGHPLSSSDNSQLEGTQEHSDFSAEGDSNLRAPLHLLQKGISVRGDSEQTRSGYHAAKYKTSSVSHEEDKKDNETVEPILKEFKVSMQSTHSQTDFPTTVKLVPRILEHQESMGAESLKSVKVSRYSQCDAQEEVVLNSGASSDEKPSDIESNEYRKVNRTILKSRGFSVPLRVPLSPRSPHKGQPMNDVPQLGLSSYRYSSESDDSFTMSQNETSETSDGEGKLLALQEQLSTRKIEAEKLKKERRRIRREKTASQELALQKQIAFYDNFIQNAREDLEKEKMEVQKISTVRPVIKKPESRRKSKVHELSLVSSPEKSELSDFSLTSDGSRSERSSQSFKSHDSSKSSNSSESSVRTVSSVPAVSSSAAADFVQTGSLSAVTSSDPLIAKQALKEESSLPHRPLDNHQTSYQRSNEESREKMQPDIAPMSAAPHVTTSTESRPLPSLQDSLKPAELSAKSECSSGSEEASLKTSSKSHSFPFFPISTEAIDHTATSEQQNKSSSDNSSIQQESVVKSIEDAKSDDCFSFEASEDFESSSHHSISHGSSEKESSGSFVESSDSCQKDSSHSSSQSNNSSGSETIVQSPSKFDGDEAVTVIAETSEQQDSTDRVDNASKVEIFIPSEEKKSADDSSIEEDIELEAEGSSADDNLPKLPVPDIEGVIFRNGGSDSTGEVTLSTDRDVMLKDSNKDDSSPSSDLSPLEVTVKLPEEMLLMSSSPACESDITRDIWDTTQNSQDALQSSSLECFGENKLEQSDRDDEEVEVAHPTVMVDHQKEDSNHHTVAVLPQTTESKSVLPRPLEDVTTSMEDKVGLITRHLLTAMVGETSNVFEDILAKKQQEEEQKTKHTRPCGEFEMHREKQECPDGGNIVCIEEKKVPNEEDLLEGTEDVDSLLALLQPQPSVKRIGLLRDDSLAGE